MQHTLLTVFENKSFPEGILVLGPQAVALVDPKSDACASPVASVRVLGLDNAVVAHTGLWRVTSIPRLIDL